MGGKAPINRGLLLVTFHPQPGTGGEGIVCLSFSQNPFSFVNFPVVTQHQAGKTGSSVFKPTSLGSH